MTEQLPTLLKEYCRLKPEGGAFESRQSVSCARSVLYRYFAKIVPGGEDLTAPMENRTAGRATVKRTKPRPSQDPAMPQGPPQAPPLPQPSREEIKARFSAALEEALDALGKALLLSRQDLARFGLNSIRTIDFKLRIFTAGFPSLAGRGNGNYFDLENHSAYGAIVRYQEACRKLCAGRKAFFFETFEGAPVASRMGRNKKR